MGNNVRERGRVWISCREEVLKEVGSFVSLDFDWEVVCFGSLIHPFPWSLSLSGLD